MEGVYIIKKDIKKILKVNNKKLVVIIVYESIHKKDK